MLLPQAHHSQFLINLALIIAAGIGYGLQRLFYGPLRPIETEQLYDKAWFAVSETLLAMTIFRDDIGIWFFAMFLCLLAGKVWQWIAEGRVEFLEQQPPANPRLFHTRLMSSLLLSVSFDIFMTQHCINSIKHDVRPGVMVMFGFEYVLLAIASVSTLMRYALSLAEIIIVRRQETARDQARNAAREQARQRAAANPEDPAATIEEEDEDDEEVPGWEEKGRWVFYLDLTTDFIKSVVYVGFFMILMTFYGLPIHIMRDLFITVRSFIKRINDFMRYRHATQDMNARYPDATAEELDRENTCIVCREEMRPWVEPGADGAPAGRRVDERQRPKKLPCGHVLHFSCLRSWLERQQVCPTCRRPVLGGSTTAQNNNPNNQANAGQANQGNLGNPMAARPDQPAGQAGQQGQAPQAGGNDRPAGNMRVFNLGPIRIALGNVRLPANQPGNGDAQDNNRAIANFAQQLLDQNQNRGRDPDPAQYQNQNPNPNQNQHQHQHQSQSQNQNQNQGQDRAPPQVRLQGLPFAPTPLPSAVAFPGDIQAEILRLQQIIIDSVRLLHVQHDQLEYMHALLAELDRIRQASNSVSVRPGPAISMARPPAPMTPFSYLANGPVLRPGDAGLPDGLQLPEGYTLRRMEAQAPRSTTSVPRRTAAPPAPGGTTFYASGSTASPAPGGTAPPAPAEPPAPARPEPTTTTTTGTADPRASSSSPDEESQTDSSSPSPSPSPSPSHVMPRSSWPTRQDDPSPATDSTSKATELGPQASSWSFGGVPGTSEGEGSSSAAADPSSEASNVTKRTATVEEAEDNGS